MIILCTDFGNRGPYVGQIKAVLYRDAPEVPVIELFSDLPRFDPQSAAYLIAAYSEEFPVGSVFLGVVDPGVGGKRLPIMVQADQRWYVGPDNGLFSVVVRRARAKQAWEIDWKPKVLSESFHGRDLFAPVTARLALGQKVSGHKLSGPGQSYREWPDELHRVIYLDTFGNAMTGIRAKAVQSDGILEVNGRELSEANTFSDVPVGAGFWYENANGLVEIAVNQGNAADDFGITVGTPVTVR